jgi:hypothetical protein
MDDRSFHEQILPRMLELHREPLDPNLVAAYVADALSPEECAALEPRLRADPEARLLIEVLREEHAESAQGAQGVEAPAVPRGHWWLPAAAAVVLFAVGLAALRWRTPVPHADLPTRIAAAAADLRAHAPVIFGDFTPFDGDVGLPAAGATRGGVVWLGPRGVVLRAPDELRWRLPRDASRVEVTLVSPSFRWSAEVEGEHSPAPALPPGRYVVTIRALDSLAAQSTTRTFEIVDAAGVVRHQRALSLIRERAPADIADVLVAHYALRARLLDLARETLAASQSEDPAVQSALAELQRWVDALTGAGS